MASDSDPRPTLDMNHGFMYSIIRNQVDRDDFDQEQKLLNLEKEVKGMETAKEDRKRKERRAPITQVYIPPHQRHKNSTSPEKTTDQESPTKAHLDNPELQLRLEFEGKDGGITHLDIYKDDDLKKSVKIFATKHDLEPRLRDALYHRLLQELQGT